MHTTERQERALVLGCCGFVALALAAGMWIAATPTLGSPSLTLSGSPRVRLDVGRLPAHAAPGSGAGGAAPAESGR